EKSPPPYLLEITTLFAGYIDVLIQHFLLSESLSIEKSIYQRQELIRSTIVENSHEGILVLDTALLVEDINSTAEIMFGYTRNEVIGYAVENILISPDRVIPALISASHGKSFPSLPGITLHRRNGQSFPADLKILPVERDGKVQAVVVLINDISENEQIRAQTRQLEQRAFLGEFMGVFAHEVLNPLNGISTGLQLLATRLGEDSPHRDLIARMEADCNRLAHQMEALKSLSKPYEPKQEPVNIGEVVSRLVERWRPRMARLKIMPIVQVDDNVPKVLGDWRALEQVFMNLISNAMDAMSQEGGVLSIRVKRNYSETLRPQVEITVTDNGPGIPEEIRDRIFQPFVTTKPHGTGLGLPITKRIITAHHGTIKVSSFPGGTVFHVYLPAIPEEEG
ncbi:two-component system sensor histidine kinase NtrB, partial [Thermanaerothrix sp.]|uniref:two-component system sensor histidine kinase NtrB n=1 Tax=Thermanaerothrix sp. TaxID=2972675 RepID=UPI003C7EB8A4